jgi:hypothetical protein
MGNDMKKKLTDAQFRKLFTKSINSYLSTLPPEEQEKRIKAAHATAMKLCGSSDQIPPDTRGRDQNHRLVHNSAE